MTKKKNRLPMFGKWLSLFLFIAMIAILLGVFAIASTLAKLEGL
jgi:hypothetical protein